MADTRRQHTQRKRQFSSDADSMTVGAARQRRLRRIGSDSERKPLPVIAPRPRRDQDDALASGLRRQKRKPRAVTSSPGMPPVMARGGMESMAVKRPRRNQPKRRFDIPLGGLVADAAGAEIRLPALPRLQLGGRAISGALVLMLLACLGFIWFSPAFRVGEVQVAGFERVTLDEVTSALGVMGDSIFFVDGKEMEQTLQAMYPELKDVDVMVSLPGKLKVSATERQPVIAWTQDDKELWIDAEGVSFLQRGSVESTLVRVKAQNAPAGSLPVNTEADSAPLPGVTLAAAPQMRISPELVSTILALNTVTPPDTLLLYNAEHGMGWNDKQHGWKVFFGNDTRDIDQKLMVYQALVSKFNAQDIHPVMVSVEYLHAPYYRLER